MMKIITASGGSHMQTRFVHWRSPVAATLILVLLIAAVSVFVTANVNDRE